MTGDARTFAQIKALRDLGNIQRGDTLLAERTIGQTGTLTYNITNMISVKDYGALGDGVTDDTAAIQAALDDIVNLETTGIALNFPPGLYIISDTLNIPVTEGLGLIIQGSGRRVTTLKRAVSFTSGDILFADDNGNSFDGWLSICDVTLGSRASTTSGASIHIKDRSNVRISNCFIEADYLGVWLEGDVQYVSCDNIIYTQSSAVNPAFAGFYFSGGHQADTKIDNCTIIGADPTSNNYLANGFLIETTDSIQITNCQVLASYGLNIEAGHGQHIAFVFVSNCIFDTSRKAGILLQGSNNAQAKLYQNIRIADTHINQYPAGGYENSVGVLVTGDCDYISIIGCNINSCGSAGVLFDQPTLNWQGLPYRSLQVLSNDISSTNMDDNNASGIIVSDGTSGVSIIGNFIGNRTGADFSKYAIALDGNNTNIIIANNNMVNQEDGGIFYNLAVNDTNYPNLLVYGNINANDRLNTVNAGIWQGTQVAVPYGGSNRTSATAYTPIVGGTTSTSAHQSMASAGAAGQLMASAGNAAVPIWTTPKYPVASITANKILISNGTDFVGTTSTFADTYAASAILYSNGANNVAGLSTVNNGVLGSNGIGVPVFSTTLPTGLAFQTPASGNLSNCTNYPLAQLTGAGAGVLTFLATPSSANLAAALTDETGSGAAVFATSPTVTTPNIVGTATNNDAAAGSVGEEIRSAVTAQAITTATITNITSISLTAGDWEVFGHVTTAAGAGTLTTTLIIDLNATSVTFSSHFTQTGQSTGAGGALGACTRTTRFSLASTTTIYLVGFVDYSVSTLTVSAELTARRLR